MSRKDNSMRWQPPSRLAPGKDRTGWAEEIIQDGERWLQSQPFWGDLTRAEDIVRGKEMIKADENRSDLTSNRLKLRAREIVASISDVRYPDAWGSDNKAYAAQAAMFSEVAKGVWFESRASSSIRRLSQWMVLGGQGTLWPTFRRRKQVDPYSTAICFDDYGPRDVIPFMMPQNNNIQECYAVTVVKMMSPPKAHSLFPLFADKLRPVNRKRMRSEAVSSRMAFINSLRGSDNSASPWTDQLCEIRYTLIDDLSINETDMPIPMGESGASWSYIVPARGADIPTGEVIGGQRKMRAANIDDCRLYPNKRLLVTGSGVNEPLYDGPAWDWHGMFPPRFCADDWVSESTSFSLLRDVFDTERCRQFTERAVDMKIKAQMDPAMIYDQTSINPGTAEEFDPWEMRKRLGVDGDVDKVLKTAIPAELLKIGTEPFEFLEYLAKSEDEQLGANQMAALAKAKMSSSEGADDLLRMAGPIVRDISASMEPPMADVLEMVKYQILQFMNTARVMTYVGPDGVTPETFDFDPARVIPSHMPGEDESGPSQWSRMERAKEFARNLRLQVAPGSIHGITQTSQKLLLLQGKKSGEPIPSRIIFEKVYGINNYEQLRDEWRADEEWKLEMAAKMKQEGASLMPSAPPGNASSSGSQKGTGGRPPSNKKPPTAKTKGSSEGPRGTVTTS